MKRFAAAALAAVILFDGGAHVRAQPGPALQVKADGIGKNGFIDQAYAFCIPAAEGHVTEGPDKNIGLSWSAGPEGTKSYAIIAVDPDVPAVFDDAGKEGKTLPASLKRKNFYHWVLLDIPAATHAIAAGADSATLEKTGKSEMKTAYGLRGVNNYAGYFAGDPARKGIYAGYDGPCPPWNDERIHHYHFRVYALDVASLNLTGQVTGAKAEEAIAGHVLARGEVVGKYTLNPQLKP